MWVHLFFDIKISILTVHFCVSLLLAARDADWDITEPSPVAMTSMAGEFQIRHQEGYSINKVTPESCLQMWLTFPGRMDWIYDGKWMLRQNSIDGNSTNTKVLKSKSLWVHSPFQRKGNNVKVNSENSTKPHIKMAQDTRELRTFQ